LEGVYLKIPRAFSNVNIEHNIYYIDIVSTAYRETSSSAVTKVRRFSRA
jgi:hypothetical protein